MKKKMGLPDIPSAPEIPRGAEVPDIPKVPKVPKAPAGAGNAEAPQEDSALPQKSQKSKIAHKEEEPTEEEQSLFGRMESSKSLSKAANVPAETLQPLPKPETKVVMKVASTENGVKLELESANGQREEMILAPDKEVLQSLSGGDLQRNMTVSLDVTRAPEGWVARKITVK